MRVLVLCSVLRHNVSDAEVEQYTRAYDVYRKSLTSHRIALFPSKLPEVVMNLSLIHI